MASRDIQRIYLGEGEQHEGWEVARHTSLRAWLWVQPYMGNCMLKGGAPVITRTEAYTAGWEYKWNQRWLRLGICVVTLNFNRTTSTTQAAVSPCPPPLTSDRSEEEGWVEGRLDEIDLSNCGRNINWFLKNYMDAFGFWRIWHGCFWPNNPPPTVEVVSVPLTRKPKTYTSLGTDEADFCRHPLPTSLPQAKTLPSSEWLQRHFPNEAHSP